MTPDYPYIQKTLDTITPISAVMGGLGLVIVLLYRRPCEAYSG